MLTLHNLLIVLALILVIISFFKGAPCLAVAVLLICVDLLVPGIR